MSSETEAAPAVRSPFYWNLGASTEPTNRSAARVGSLNWRDDVANHVARRVHVTPEALREIQTSLCGLQNVS